MSASLKSADVILPLSYLKLSDNSPSAYGIKPKLPSLVFTALPNDLSPLQPPSFPHSLSTLHRRLLHRLFGLLWIAFATLSFWWISRPQRSLLCFFFFLHLLLTKLPFPQEEDSPWSAAAMPLPAHTSMTVCTQSTVNIGFSPLCSKLLKARTDTKSLCRSPAPGTVSGIQQALFSWWMTKRLPDEQHTTKGTMT